MRDEQVEHKTFWGQWNNDKILTYPGHYAFDKTHRTVQHRMESGVNHELCDNE